MVISILANGDIKNIIPENIYQGSNKANTIYVVAPFALNVKALISFEVMTTGQLIEAQLMETPVGISNELNLWKCDVSHALTQYYGEVKYQVKFISGEETIAVAKGKFRVQEGVDFDLPESPDEATYTLILQKLSDIEAHYLNGWIEAQAIKIYNSEFAYSLNSHIFGEEDGKVYLYKSLIENNKGNAITDRESWEKIDLGVDVSEVVGRANAYTDAEIEKIKDGTIIAGKADKDSEGNIITAHYATQEQWVENMEAIESNAKRINAVAQNITAIIDGNIIVGKATKDGSGNNIAETYSTKSETNAVDEKLNYVIDGAIPVQRANADGGGNIIPSTYVMKTQITTTFDGIQNHQAIPSAKLVKDTISNALGDGSTDLVFDTYQHFRQWLLYYWDRPDWITPDEVMRIGLGILIKEEGYPDYWCSSDEKPYSVENNFTPFEAKISVEDFLAKDNTKEYTPTSDYNPATKKYVDDMVGFVIYTGPASSATGSYGCIPFRTTQYYLAKGTIFSTTKSDKIYLSKYPSGEAVNVGDIFYAYCVPIINGSYDFRHKFYALLKVTEISLSEYTLRVENEPVRVVASEVVTKLSSTSSDYQVPSAKAVYDIVAPLADKSYVDNLVGDIDTLLTNLNSGSGV